LKFDILTLEAGKNHRLRLINAGAFAEFQVQIDKHDFDITEVDGTDVAAVNNVRFQRLNILPAQRYSIVLSANASSTSESFWIRARMVTHCFGEENPYMQEEVRAIVQYASQNHPPSAQPIPTNKDWPEVIELKCRDLNTGLLRPIVPAPPPLSADVTVYLRSNFENCCLALEPHRSNASTVKVSLLIASPRSSPASSGTPSIQEFGG